MDIPLRSSATQSVQQQQQPLISPITGQPLSHVPAPLLLSSSTVAGAGGSSFRLARSSTQPLQSPRVAHLAGGQGAASPLSSLTRQPSGSDSGSFSEQLTLSVGNDSERIFAMSGVGDDDSAIQSLGEEPAAAAAGAVAVAGATPPSSSGLARSNSVRARANMFQQLQQEQTRSRRETTGGEQLPQRATGNRQGECAKVLNARVE